MSPPELASGGEPTVGEIHRTLLRFETKLDKVTDDHETRLRKLERWMYAVPPTVLTAVGAVIVAIVKA